MKVRKSGTRILWYECIGFGLILLLSWLNEFLALPDLLLGSPRHPANLRDSLIESVAILVIWAVVFVLTRRLLIHLHYLEDFLRVCAWCRKVGYRGKWMRLEDYFAEGFNIETTHGMCPECLKQVEEDTKKLYREQLEQQNAAAPKPEIVPPHGTTQSVTTPLAPLPSPPQEPGTLHSQAVINQKAA